MRNAPVVCLHYTPFVFSLPSIYLSSPHRISWSVFLGFQRSTFRSSQFLLKIAAFGEEAIFTRSSSSSRIVSSDDFRAKKRTFRPQSGFFGALRTRSTQFRVFRDNVRTPHPVSEATNPDPLLSTSRVKCMAAPLRTSQSLVSLSYIRRPCVILRSRIRIPGGSMQVPTCPIARRRM